jgi:hypothetical protein
MLHFCGLIRLRGLEHGFLGSRVTHGAENKSQNKKLLQLYVVSGVAKRLLNVDRK